MSFTPNPPSPRSKARVSPTAGAGPRVVDLRAWREERGSKLQHQGTRGAARRASARGESTKHDRLGNALAWASVMKQTGRNLCDPKDLGPRP